VTFEIVYFWLFFVDILIQNGILSPTSLGISTLLFLLSQRFYIFHLIETLISVAFALLQ
jgi:hypothetical protein